MEDSANTELVRSHVDTIILRTLQNKDSYPYEILREIEELSSGKYVLKQATLYSCMKRLEKIGYINSYWGTESEGGRRRYYSLTELGKDYLKRDKEEWEFSRTLINRLLSDKEVDLESVTPPFDASSLRPLTKRGQLKDAKEVPPGQVAEMPELNLSEQIPAPQTDFKKETSPETSRENSSETEVVKEPSEKLEYFSKEPIFQHTLPEEDRNSYKAEIDYKIFQTSQRKETKTEEPLEETEDMKAAADLLHIGKKFLDAEAFMTENRSYTPAYDSKPAQNSETRTENYRDVLNRIFDTEVAKTVSKSEDTIVSNSDNSFVASETQTLHGRHLKDLETGLEKEGYTLRIYNPKNRSDYYYNKYVYQNKLNFATNLLLFVVMAVEFIIVASLNGILHFKPITLVLSGICIAVPPVVFLLFYLWNPTKRIRANYNFMQTFLYRSVLALILIAIEVIVCLLTPSFGINFSDARMYLPWLFASNIPIYAVIYDALYRSKRFHLSCQKY